MWYLVCVFVLLAVSYLLLRNGKKVGSNALINVPCRKTLPFLGNLADFLTFVSGQKNIRATIHFFQYLRGMAVLFQEKGMFVFWAGPKPFLILCSPEAIEPILNNNQGQEASSLLSQFFKPWVGNGLFMSEGELWQGHRRLLNPSFHSRILENFLPIMNEQTIKMAQKILEMSSTRDFIDIFDVCSKCTLNVICETTMGTKTASQGSDSEVPKIIEEVLITIYERVNRPWLYPDVLFRMSTLGKRFYRAVDYLNSFCDKIIAERIQNRQMKDPEEISEEQLKSEPRKRLALLDLMLESGLGPRDIRDQVNTFVFAGHDTVGSSVSWLIYLLGHHPDVQKRLAQEVDDVFAGDNDRHLANEDLGKLKFMDMVIKESLRLYTPVPIVLKKLHEDTEINGYLMPKGTDCILSLYSSHHNPEHFPNPDVFDPERFTPENSAGRHHCAFAPFSLGLRHCIGQRFAMMEMKIMCSHILRRFRIVSLDPPDKILLLPTAILRPDGITRIKFLPRHEAEIS